MQATIGPYRGLHQRFNLSRMRDIGSLKRRIAAGLAHQTHGPLAPWDIDIAYHHACALTGEQHRCGTPLPASGASNQRHLLC
jgi:hypothetical protein